MSLRRRLLIGVLVLVTVVIGAVSSLTWVALRAFLISRVDAQLLVTPPALVAVLCDAPEGLPPPPLTYVVAIVDAEGRPGAPCSSNTASRPLNLTAADRARLVRSVGVPIQVESDGDAVRAVAVALPQGFGVIALPLADVDATLNRLVVLESLLGGVALLATAAVGAAGVRLSLRPLQQVTATARAVAGEVSRGVGGLDRRVHQPSADTEVGQLAGAFNQMLAEVETEVAARQDSEQRMRQFLADASHELRTPLTTLRGYAELLRLKAERDGSGLGSDERDALWRVESEGLRMARLVDDLMALARADRQPDVRRECVDLAALAVDAVADLRAAHPERRVSLWSAPGAVVEGDPDQLRQVLANLLTNAAVHADPRGAVRVEVRRRGHGVDLVVDDDGPGLTPQQAAHVFDRFWRADTTRSRARGGSGLGLPIVDALVAGHGGDIRFDTSPMAGTTVTVRLPAATSFPYPS